VNPGKEIGKGVLEGQGHGEAAHPQGRQDRSNGDAQGLQDDQGADDKDKNPGQIGEHGGGKQGASHPGAVVIHEAHEEPRRGPGKGDDHRHKERLLQEAHQARPDGDIVDRPVDPGQGEPEEGHAAEGPDGEIVQFPLRPVRQLPELVKDDLFHDQPAHHPTGQEGQGEEVFP